MGSWGTDHASATNKPKFLPEDENSDYTRADSFASKNGWVMRAGSKATGNGNTDANPEVLVAIRNLAGTSGTTGLRSATVTKMEYIIGTTAATDFTANNGGAEMKVRITYDEAVTVTGTPQLVVDNGNQSSAGQGDYTLSYDSALSSANRLVFKATSKSLSVNDVLTVGGTNIALNSGTIKDTADGATNSSLLLSGLTAITHTVLA
jgi:hypothetical protein|tara:strand:- start:3230 stop:3847 length:618 start_codon:yes stop_codon:yes gene_type:complete